MKPQKAIAILAFLTLLVTAAFFSTIPAKKASFFMEDSNKEHALYKEGSNEKFGFEEHAEVHDGHQRNSPVFNYNFLFNLLYKFAYGQLQR
jgi:hypothetical protein